MVESKLTRKIFNLREEITSMENDSHSITSSFRKLQQEVEYLKIDLLIYYLEKRRKDIVYQRGLSRVMKDKRLLKTSIVTSISGLILGGLIVKDKYNAISAGLSGFSGMVQGFGQTRCGVLLHNQLVVMSCDTIFEKGTWVTFESLIIAINDLKKDILLRKKLLTIDDIMQELRKSKRLIYILVPDTN